MKPITNNVFLSHVRPYGKFLRALVMKIVIFCNRASKVYIYIYIHIKYNMKLLLLSYIAMAYCSVKEKEKTKIINIICTARSS